jgi:maleate isomerase
MISVGVLTPHAAAGPEAEFPDMAAGHIGTRISRIPAYDAHPAASNTPPTSLAGLRALTTPTVLDEAAAAFAPGSVEVICVASTSTGYAIGFDAEATMVARLSQRWSLPVVGTSLSAVAALRAFDIERVSVVHPPWFDDELNDRGATYFRSQGFAVVASVSADLPNDPDRIESGAVVEWISRNVSDEAEGVFIGGNGFRAARAIEQLEWKLGRPVLTANQVLLWSMLANVQADIEVDGFGRLFHQRLSTTDSGT